MKVRPIFDDGLQRFDAKKSWAVLTLDGGEPAPNEPEQWGRVFEISVQIRKNGTKSGSNIQSVIGLKGNFFGASAPDGSL